MDMNETISATTVKPQITYVENNIYIYIKGLIIEHSITQIAYLKL